MHINNKQQEHSYHEFIQNFSFLFKKIKEKDESIHTTLASFNTVKFLIERGWIEDKDEDEACKVILQEYNKIMKAKQTPEATQKLEIDVKERLKEYIDGIVEGVSIYGNHASITLEGNKKEFKISEFLNDPFYKNNGISGFSILYSKYTSDNTKLECGMHGFVYDNIRHYVVTDGSYEMNLSWYDTGGNKCSIKINIDKEGVEFIEGNITEGQLKTDPLKVNKDVKIGGLFLHQIQFRKKGKEQENAVQKDSQSCETITRKATHTNRGVGSQTTHSDSGNDSDHKSQEGNAKNKRTPPPPPLKTSSLRPRKGASDGNQKLDRNEQENSTPNKTSKNIKEFQANPNSHTSSRNDSGFSSPTTDHNQSQVDSKHLTRKLEEEKLNHQKEDETLEEH
ncbi:hypothetical protein QUS22_05385, partial [Wolbachia pipientis]|nr:hypothetical protein [Wolbachia pipientis]